jgi:hypothetical protein
MEAAAPAPAPGEHNPPTPPLPPAPLPRGRACAACGVARVVLARPKDGARLCKECFCAAFEDDVHATIVRHGLFRAGERVAVAASGGKGEARREVLEGGGRGSTHVSDAAHRCALTAAPPHPRAPAPAPVPLHHPPLVPPLPLSSPPSLAFPQTRRCWRTC